MKILHHSKQALVFVYFDVNILEYFIIKELIKFSLRFIVNHKLMK